MPLPEPAPVPAGDGGGLDRTAKLYIGGAQVRPDSGYSYPVFDRKGRLITEVGLGNRKDVRNAVEAAGKAEGWSAMTGHQRAQVLYFLAENLDMRRDAFASRLGEVSGARPAAARREVELSVSRIMRYAAWADKFDGAVRAPQPRMLSLALVEPYGVLAISCPDEAPLLAFISLVLPAIAMGNRVVVTPAPHRPLPALDFYQVLDTSDVPGGVVNIVTGDRDVLAETLARHDDVAAMWYFGGAAGSAAVERESAGNLKPVWASGGKARDWFAPAQGEAEEFLRRATQIKTVWTPYGV
jgi:aldehyde dehydrogenase (NAD+)